MWSREAIVIAVVLFLMLSGAKAESVMVVNEEEGKRKDWFLDEHAKAMQITAGCFACAYAK